MDTSTIVLKYVLCFIKKDNGILLIKRNKLPWKSRWNGVGGKLKDGETAASATHREVLEETEFDTKISERVDFTGIVTWNAEVEPNNSKKNIFGLYVFIIEASKGQKAWNNERITREGVLAWKSIDWVLDKTNDEIAHNIPHFLPDMLQGEKPARYQCHFKGDTFIKTTKFHLPQGITIY